MHGIAGDYITVPEGPGVQNIMTCSARATVLGDCLDTLPTPNRALVHWGTNSPHLSGRTTHQAYGPQDFSKA